MFCVLGGPPRSHDLPRRPTGTIFIFIPLYFSQIILFALLVFNNFNICFFALRTKTWASRLRGRLSIWRLLKSWISQNLYPISNFQYLCATRKSCRILEEIWPPAVPSTLASISTLWRRGWSLWKLTICFKNVFSSKFWRWEPILEILGFWYGLQNLKSWILVQIQIFDL